jgi:hypothetical protein
MSAQLQGMLRAQAPIMHDKKNMMRACHSVLPNGLQVEISAPFGTAD